MSGSKKYKLVNSTKGPWMLFILDRMHPGLNIGEFSYKHRSKWKIFWNITNRMFASELDLKRKPQIRSGFNPGHVLTKSDCNQGP